MEGRGQEDNYLLTTTVWKGYYRLITLVGLVP